MTLPLQDKLEAVLQASVLSQEDPDLVSRPWNACSSSMYSLQPQERQLGMGDEVSSNTSKRTEIDNWHSDLQ